MEKMKNGKFFAIVFVILIIISLSFSTAFAASKTLARGPSAFSYTLGNDSWERQYYIYSSAIGQNVAGMKIEYVDSVFGNKDKCTVNAELGVGNPVSARVYNINGASDYYSSLELRNITVSISHERYTSVTYIGTVGNSK